MRVLAACSLGGAGHLNPLLPFLEAARRRGDETLVVGPPALSDLVERSGHPFLAGGEPPEETVAGIRERLPVIPHAEAVVLAGCELFGRLATVAMLPAMDDICDRWAPDLVLRDPCEYASAVVAPRRGIATVQVAISQATAEWGSIAAASPALEQHQPGLADELRASPYLTRFPASLDPSAFPTTVRFHHPAAAPGDTLPDWWDGSSAPLVYVTFGTVLGYMSLAGEVYRSALDAVRGLDARVLLTVGDRFDTAGLGTVPPNVHVEAWVKQARVLRGAALVVCHGGSGTVFGALEAGVPVVSVPLFADQFLNASVVAEAGAGVVAERASSAIADGIAQVMGDPSYRRHAGQIATEMAATPTVEEALAALLPPP